MNKPAKHRNPFTHLACAALLVTPAFSAAQVPVDDDGNVIGSYEPATEGHSDNSGALLSATELQELVGPVALYPDDLLAIVLPASAYPLQIVEAGRFLEAHKADASLKPDPDWDDTVVALINYPEVIELLNEDLDWTYRLGEAVVAQQTDVVAAVESFRDRAYASGNLKSDSHQTVSQDDGVIEISPVADDVIYVPYYEPERVVVYQSRPSYFYHPRPYPVYYYPYSSHYYSSGHYFDHGYFWGVTTAFSIGWLSDSLHVYHHSYHGHPFYGHSYRNRYWYRRPSISVYNNTYVYNRSGATNRYYGGDRWRARNTRRANLVREGYARPNTQSEIRTDVRSTGPRVTRQPRNETISFRNRDRQLRDGQRVASVRNTRSESQSAGSRVSQVTRTPATSKENRRQQRQIEFRPRESQRQRPAARATERQNTVVRSSSTQRQRPGAQARVSDRRPAARQARERREQPVRQRATPQRQQNRGAARTSESAPRQQESRQRESSGKAERSQRRSDSRSSRTRDRGR